MRVVVKLSHTCVVVRCVMLICCCRNLDNVGDEGLKAIAATNQGIEHLHLEYDVVSLCLPCGSH